MQPHIAGYQASQLHHTSEKVK